MKYSLLIFLICLLGVNLFPVNSQAQWIQTNAGLTQTRVFAFAVAGTDLFAGANGGVVFRSANNAEKIDRRAHAVRHFALRQQGGLVNRLRAEGQFTSHGNCRLETYPPCTGGKSETSSPLFNL